MFMNLNYGLCHYRFNFELNNSLGFFADIVTVLGVLGLVLAYIDYRRRIKEEKRFKIEETLHAITSIKSQLTTIGYWTSYETGGYKK